MKKTIKILLVMILVVTAGLARVYGASSKKFKIVYSERFRLVSWDNSINLDDSADDAFSFMRYRVNLGARWRPAQNLEIMTMLTNEFRYYMTPKNRDFNLDEVIFSQLYLKWKNVGQLPLTLTLGRQNIILGEGFVVLEAHPLDGSRSIYFNAIRGDYQIDKNHRMTAFVSYQPETDNMLPIINDRDQPLIEQPETGFALYYTGKFKKTGVEAYFIRKDVDATDDHPTASGINTLGTRWSIPLADKWSLTTEGAYQFGTRGDENRSAVGGYFHLDYALGKTKIPLVRKLTLGGIYLSGDDPATGKVEGWDPVFGRWPKWSEAYIYTLIKENGVAYWSNLNSLYVSLAMELAERVDLTCTWHRLGAMESGSNAFTGGGGKTRGDLFISFLKFKINKYFAGHIRWEYFNPGNFYFNGADEANWFRVEMIYSF